MDITVEQVQGKVPVTIFRISGDLDGSTYRDLIAKGQEAFQAGAQALLLDLTETRFVSSAGMVALHSLAKIMRGTKSLAGDEGWEAFRDIDRQRAAGRQKDLKLLNPQPKVKNVLEMAGFDQFFDIYTDEAEAVASF
jgi:anti-anti-sigma regulatory factor